MDVVYGGHGTMRKENTAGMAYTGTENTTGAANMTERENMAGASAANSELRSLRCLVNCEGGRKWQIVQK